LTTEQTPLQKRIEDKRNDQAVLDDMKNAAEQLEGLDSDIAQLQKQRTKVKNEFVKKHGINLTMFNVAYRLYKLEQQETQQENLSDLAMASEALGLQLPLFGEGVNASAPESGQDGGGQDGADTGAGDDG